MGLRFSVLFILCRVVERRKKVQHNLARNSNSANYVDPTLSVDLKSKIHYLTCCTSPITNFRTDIGEPKFSWFYADTTPPPPQNEECKICPLLMLYDAKYVSQLN